jgi:hypothetical protein
MTNRIVMCLALAAAFVACDASAQKTCTPADAAKAEKAIDRVVSWEQLYKAYQDYAYCDTGSVDDVFTDALLRLVVDWKNVDGLAKPMEKDRGYRDFVHKHLNSPAAKGDLDNVYSRAKVSCPKGLDAFCSDLAMTVKPFAGMESIKVTSDPAAAPAPPAAPAAPAAPPKK